MTIFYLILAGAVILTVWALVGRWSAQSSGTISEKRKEARRIEIEYGEDHDDPNRKIY